MAHIRLSDVGVEFPIHNAHSRSLQLQVFGKLGGKLAQHKQAVFVRALQGVNLSFEDGDRVGIIGHNGAGKTTLLRVLAGVYEPTFGSISVDGRLSSFTDITLGMDPEATGLENIIFRCVFMGLSFAEARRLSPSIQEFSELGEFLRLPVRTYSTGMFLRLAFAISTSIEPDIIIMDEMIAGGDARFIEKAKVAPYEPSGANENPGPRHSWRRDRWRACATRSSGSTMAKFARSDRSMKSTRSILRQMPDRGPSTWASHGLPRVSRHQGQTWSRMGRAEFSTGPFALTFLTGLRFGVISNLKLPLLVGYTAHCDWSYREIQAENLRRLAYSVLELIWEKQWSSGRLTSRAAVCGSDGRYLNVKT